MRTNGSGADLLPKAAWIAACLAIVASACTGEADLSAGALSPRPTATKDPRPRHVVFDVRTGEATDLPAAVTSIRDPGEFRMSPDGMKVAFTGLDGVSLPRDVFVARLDGSRVRQVTDGPLSASDPQWSPDGSTILYTVEVKGSGSPELANLYTVDLDGGRATQITHGDDVEFWRIGSGATFGPDGRTILFTRSDGRGHLDLWTMSADGKRPSLLLGDAAYGVYSPDGSTIAFQRTGRPSEPGSMWPTDRGIWLAAADGTDVRPLEGAGPVVGSPLGRKRAGPSWSPDGRRVVYTGGAGARVRIVDVVAGAGTTLETGGWATWVDDHTLIVEGFGAPTPGFALSDVSGTWFLRGGDGGLLTITPYGRYSFEGIHIDGRTDELGTVELVGDSIAFEPDGGGTCPDTAEWTLSDVAIDAPDRMTATGTIGACGRRDDRAISLVLRGERPTVFDPNEVSGGTDLPTADDIVGVWAVDGEDAYHEYRPNGVWGSFSNSMGDPELSDGTGAFEGGVEGRWWLRDGRLRLRTSSFEPRACTGPDGSGRISYVDDPRSRTTVYDVELMRPGIMVLTVVKDWCWGMVGVRTVQIGTSG